MFDENKLIKDGLGVISDVEKNIRNLKTEYQKALKDYERLKNGDATIFEEMESQYLKLLSKLQKAIEDSTELWDKAIANVERLRHQKKVKAEYFMTGVIWTANIAQLAEEDKNKIIEDAKKLIV